MTPCAGCVESTSAFRSTIHPAAVPCRGDPRIVSGWHQSARSPARRGLEKGWSGVEISVYGMLLAGEEGEEEEKEDARMRRVGRIKASPLRLGETTGSWISTRWSRSRWVVRVGERCVEPKLHPQLSISPPPPLLLLSSVIHLPYSLV